MCLIRDSGDIEIWSGGFTKRMSGPVWDRLSIPFCRHTTSVVGRCELQECAVGVSYLVEYSYTGLNPTYPLLPLASGPPKMPRLKSSKYAFVSDLALTIETSWLAKRSKLFAVKKCPVPGMCFFDNSDAFFFFFETCAAHLLTGFWNLHCTGQCHGHRVW